jgi:phage FluMu gp28-like protein/transposase-like protein
MPRFSAAQKERALAFFEAGLAIEEIAEDCGVPAPTLYRWRKNYKTERQSDNETIAGVKKQIATLSKGRPNGKTAHRIALLSAALSRLEGVKSKKERARAKVKPIAAMNADYDALKAKALEIGGLFNYQKEFLNDPSRFRVVLKARQIGFSYVSSLDALLAALAGRSQLFLSASEEQALILMRYLDGWAQKLGVDFRRNSEYEKTLNNGAYIKAMAHNFRTVQGFSGDVWMDEFAWYPNPKRIYDVFMPSITACGGRLTILSTPFEEQSLFYNIAIDPENRYYMYSRHRVDISRAMRDGLKVDDFNVLRDMTDADMWASAYECQFIDDETALLPIALIKSCVEDYKLRLPSENVPIYGGFDVGRVKDRSVLAAIIADNGVNRLVNLEVLVKASFAEQERVLTDFLKTRPLALLKIDKTGIGMATAEKLQTAFSSRAKGVYFTAATKEALALNLKKHFEDKKIIIPNDPALIADLHAVKRKAGTKSFLYDADRNARGHADRFWALALALSYFETIRDRKGRAWIV